MGHYVKKDNIFYWVTDSGKEIPVDIKLPPTRMRRDFFRPFISRAAQLFKNAAFKIDHDNSLTKRAKQWKKDQGIISLDFDELLKKVENGKAHISQKVDGQSSLMEYKDGKAQFGSLAGRVMWDLPVLNEIGTILKNKGIKQAVMMGELAGMEKGKILPFRESQSFIKNSRADKEKLHWFPYQILEINGESTPEGYESYVESFQRLKKLFSGAKHVHPVEASEGSSEALKKAWDKLVEKEGNEGLVVRIGNKVYKSKPVFTYDLVIVAVGSKKGKNWPKKQIGNTLMAFMDKDGNFRIAGEVGTGWNVAEKEDLFKWAQKNKVDEDDTYVWVKPQRIMEIQWERSNIKDMPVYKYSRGKYEKLGKKPVGTIVKPRFIRYRDDKSVSPSDLRLTQVPDWNERQAKEKPISFNDFICKHTQILIDDPAADDHFPPQRAQMLYDMYKNLLSRGDAKGIRYHKKLKEMHLSDPNRGQNKHSMARRIVARVLSPSEALYGFAGWLTSRGEPTVMSELHDAGNVAEKVDLFCKTNKLPDPQNGWEKALIHPKTATGEIFKGSAYRVESGYKHGKGQTALDVIKHEAHELGNKDILKQARKSGVDLESIPASRTVWVTKNKEDAERYGEPEKFSVPPGSVVIAEDGEGGYLLALRAMKTADYPDHPDEVVISKSENILGNAPLIELDVWSYYEGVKSKIIPQLKGKDLFIVVKPDGKPIYIRHPYDKKTEFIRINNDEEFETYHSGRTVEYHITAESQVDFYAVDMDPPGTSTEDFNKAKKAAGEIADAMKKIPEVGTISINYTGKRGFHIFGKLKSKKDVSDVRKFVQGWLKDTFGDDDRYTLAESPSKGKIALGVAPLKINGGHVALWSMRVSGLCCVEVPRNKLSSFTRESATPQKIHQKLTGKPLKQIKKLAVDTSNLDVVKDFIHRTHVIEGEKVDKEVVDGWVDFALGDVRRPPERHHRGVIGHLELIQGGTPPSTVDDIRQMYKIIGEKPFIRGKGEEVKALGEDVIYEKGENVLARLEAWIDKHKGKMGTFSSHRDFELIHPAEDGNGRVGRLILLLAGYPIRRLLKDIETKSAYLNKLKGVKMGSPKKVVEAFCEREAVIRTEFSPEPALRKPERQRMIKMIKDLPKPKEFAKPGEEYLAWDGKKWVLEVK